MITLQPLPVFNLTVITFDGYAVLVSFDSILSVQSTLINKQFISNIFCFLVCKRWCVVAKASWQSVEVLTFANVFQGLKFAVGMFLVHIQIPLTGLGLTSVPWRKSVLLSIYLYLSRASYCLV